jgi:mRNA-degrading endonuclease RelE of RelBE toxin-antitoxin system
MATPLTIKYEFIEAFEKDLKRLLKKFPTLADDLETAKRNAIELRHLKGMDNSSIFPISGFCRSEMSICKLKKFACRSLKGRGARSGIRVIYAFYERDFKVVFIEIYHKSENKNEDAERIKNYFKTA